MFYHKITNYYQNLSLLRRFSINLVGVFLASFLFFQVIRDLSPVLFLYEEFIYHFTNFLLNVSAFIIDILGHKTAVYGKILYLDDFYSIHLDRGCLARNLMLIYVGFIIAFPSSIKHKFWYIPAGLIIIIFINILRIIGLIFTLKYYPQYMDVNHHLVFKYVVYTIVFILWYIWISVINKNIFSLKNKKSK